MSGSSLCLWYESGAEAAAEFYAATIPDTAILGIERAPADNPSTAAGAVLLVRIRLAGHDAVLLNGGQHFRLSEAFSLQIHTDDQEQTDRLWGAIVDGDGSPSMCGWCKDKWGLSWQITPRALTSALSHPDPQLRKRAFEAMMGMNKIDIAAIEAAIGGAA
ncbi:MAG: VOC family protein [Novosphingobium sp.]|uniref:VOC family protein n=1 Tax=Novosphingobium sp. TaxID=1874826 RepID=UPI001D2FD126|nr:VOC family protein [Novosphingobium sp.]MCB2056349.1 VOC family protein [Novosphingobium sp.]MCP5385342.1 VOC family protein [Novosphingobium sp.]